MRTHDAVYACLVAAGAAAALTPLAGRLARRVGAVNRPRDRGLSDRPVPLLGGLAILAALALGIALWLPWGSQVRGIVIGAVIVCGWGALDDARDLPAGVKLLGQVAAAIVPVVAGVSVQRLNLPFIGPFSIAAVSGPVTVLGLVALMNAVNFSDGVDGLAAGVCAIASIAFSIIAFNLDRATAGVLAAIIAGAALGFLVHNFPPARVFMGDSGSQLLGYMLGCVAVQGALKTNALIALVGPLTILALPFLDTGFVIAKRLKYGRRVWNADANHFHHRFERIGFSPRRTILYLYAWSICLAGLAVALRFVPYYHNGHYDVRWLLVMAAIGLAVLAASLYLVWRLEILKLARLRQMVLRRRGPGTSEWEIKEQVVREIETGEWDALEERAR